MYAIIMNYITYGKVEDVEWNRKNMGDILYYGA